MSYVVIARKYRPQKFSEVVGQEHITRTLKNAIKLNKISHAYLFTGPRGIGKTTTARIFAKAVNCKHKKAEDPCNNCSICKEITNSESVDVMELDAASNRGIDEIRKLRENIKFAPANSKYKVYIIDEVHMLTKEAFNAILKTLEEPPPHVIFIMATTEPEKILDTIISRCQKFNFKLIPEKMIKENLQDIAEKEKVTYEEEGLWMISGAAGGSIRDAQSIMDQAISYSGDKIVVKDIGELLGLIPREVLFSYTEFIKENDIKSALEHTENLFKEGYNLNRLFNDLLKHFRNLMFAKVFGEATDFLGFDKEYSKKLADAAESFSKERLIWITEFLAKNSSRMKYSENLHIVMDTILFKLCQRYVSFDDILNMVEHGALPSETKTEEYMPKESPTENSRKKAFEAMPQKGGGWGKIIDLIKKESQPLYHSLKEAKASRKGKAIIIRCAGNLDLTERKDQILKSKISEVMGEGYYYEIIKQVAATEDPVTDEENRNNMKKKFINPVQIEDEEPVVGEIINTFGGKIEK